MDVDCPGRSISYFEVAVDDDRLDFVCAQYGNPFLRKKYPILLI
jgi:hypothetical protein